MRFPRTWMIGLFVCAGAFWIACGSDDASNSAGDAGTSDATTSDAAPGDSGGPPSDSGPTDSGSGGCDAGPFPSLPPGEVVCPGSPTHMCDTDASFCCVNHCAARSGVCAAGGGFSVCERSSDCNDHPCCLKLTGAFDLDAAACPATGVVSSMTCSGTSVCGLNDYVMCDSNAACDGGTCTPLYVSVNDGGTTVGVCVP